MDLVDEQGYKALDYATFNDDTEAVGIILRGLRRTLGGDVEQQLAQRQLEAKLRKGYRELFQELMRPVLSRGRSDNAVQELRRVYAATLAADEEKKRMFDHLKYVRYSDFVRSGKVPRYDENLVHESKVDGEQNHLSDAADFIVFFSYRWIKRESGSAMPDDSNNTQYRRMVQAAEEFLRLHPDVSPERLGIPH